MTDAARPETKPERPSSFIYFGGAGFVIALLWVWFLIEHFTDWRIVRTGQEGRPESLPVLVPLIATPIAFVAALVLWRRAVGIVENGVPVSAVIKSIGGEVQGYREVVFDYEFDGASHSQKKSVIGITVEKLGPGSPLPIIVDKRNPKRVMVK